MPQLTPGQYFRAGVGAMVIDPSTGCVLVLRRADVDEEAWQMPQGGLERGESPRDALVREVREEIGWSIGDYEIVAEHETWLVYELPEPYRSEKTGRGQVQKWFLLKAAESSPNVVPDGVEFDKAQWIPLDDLVSSTATFRQRLYRTLVDFARATDARLDFVKPP